MNIIDLGLKEHEMIEAMVVQKKYCQEGEATLEDVRTRVASHISDPHLKKWFEKTKSFLPGGSILSKGGSFSNCYFTPILTDSLEGIFDCCKAMARTYSYRGGTGINLSILRPKHTPVSNTAKTSTGAVSFAPLFSQVTGKIGQHGRRGALIMLLDVRHPDILDFIRSKSHPEEVFRDDGIFSSNPEHIRYANISVVLTDDFMKAVEKDEIWTLKFPNFEADKARYDVFWDGDFDSWEGVWKIYAEIPAREILREIANSAWMTGDPGVVFMDTVKKWTPGAWIDPDNLTPKGVNPCGEQPLADWNNCLLGALVLSDYVESPFSDDRFFNENKFLYDVENAVRFLNEMSDINENLHPLQEQREADKYGKRIGLELTGVADALAMMGLEYGSDDGNYWLEIILRKKAEEEINTSLDLASEQGCCPAFSSKSSRVEFLACPYIKRLNLDKGLQEDILKFGLRNTAFNTFGPTGSLSILAGNCTSGIEPLFAMSYQRSTTLHPVPIELIHKPVLKYLKGKGVENFDLRQVKRDLNYVEAHELHWTKRIGVQSVVQAYTDSSVSSTINLPSSATVEEIEQIYTTAWRANLKGITVFRDGCKQGVLERTKEEQRDIPRIEGLYIKDLLDVERGERHRILWKGAKMYVIVSLDEDNNPVEVFVKLPREAGMNGDGHYRAETYHEKFSLWETVTRMASLLLRSNVPLEMVIKQLDKGSFSLTDASAVLSRVLRRYLPQEEDEDGDVIGNECPECGENTFFITGGCPACQSCGYSKC